MTNNGTPPTLADEVVQAQQNVFDSHNRIVGLATLMERHLRLYQHLSAILTGPPEAVEADMPMVSVVLGGEDFLLPLGDGIEDTEGPNPLMQTLREWSESEYSRLSDELALRSQDHKSHRHLLGELVLQAHQATVTAPE